jgi:hypothetical protein
MAGRGFNVPAGAGVLTTREGPKMGFDCIFGPPKGGYAVWHAICFLVPQR